MADASVEEYIRQRPDEVRVILEEIRERVRRVLPGSGEKISYQMPTVTVDGAAVLYYAGWKHHIGMYPIPVGDATLEPLIAPYRAAKDTVRFPYRQPIPYELIEQIVRFVADRR